MRISSTARYRLLHRKRSLTTCVIEYLGGYQASSRATDSQSILFTLRLTITHGP